ncbi:hypothetical protein E3N88_28312 [Mikania micrantha]|uniref:Uncharacterized protein n=1 Tax=Mikania micrantha TaxID=192012 RepID=A0A5N6MZP3_9ASTR|nr:hypothetical protein E3N88_28312 [Mikania micrantha]
MFKIMSKKARRGGYNDQSWDEPMKAYKVMYHGDQDRTERWPVDPGVDRKASAYINDRTNKWNNVEICRADDQLMA